jgi:hypothetical protein
VTEELAGARNGFWFDAGFADFLGERLIECEAVSSSEGHSNNETKLNEWYIIE